MAPVLEDMIIGFLEYFHAGKSFLGATLLFSGTIMLFSMAVAYLLYLCVTLTVVDSFSDVTYASVGKMPNKPKNNPVD